MGPYTTPSVKGPQLQQLMRRDSSFFDTELARPIKKRSRCCPYSVSQLFIKNSQSVSLPESGVSDVFPVLLLSRSSKTSLCVFSGLRDPLFFILPLWTFDFCLRGGHVSDLSGSLTSLKLYLDRSLRRSRRTQRPLKIKGYTRNVNNLFHLVKENILTKRQ